MKVGEAGEAFFVVELNDEESRDGIPDEFVTSPILSASNSPEIEASRGPSRAKSEPPIDLDGHRAPRKLIEEDYVEPLDLGISRSQYPAELNESTGDNIDTTSARSGDPQTSQENSSISPSLKSASGRKSSIESHSTAAASESSKSSIIGSVGAVASKASGVVSTAGKSVMPSVGGGRNSRLEKLNDKEKKKNISEVRTGAQVEDHPTAHAYEPQQHSQTKERMQQKNINRPPKNLEDATTETERLEIGLRDRSLHLIESTIEAKKAEQSLDFGNDKHVAEDSNAEEEAYPAPFGGDEAEANLASYPTAQPDHEKFLAGKKLEPVESGITGRAALDPAQVDSRTVRGRLEKAQGLLADKKQEDLNNIADDSQLAHKLSQKEDTQYMLDMDGYKMTADGEDLAFAEGSRLSKEIPLSRRHGGQVDGNLISDRLNSSSLHMLGKNQRDADLSVKMGSYDLKDRSHTMDLINKLDQQSLDDLESDTIETSVEGMFGATSDELNLSRDLVRLTRSLRPSQATKPGGPIPAEHLRRRTPRRSHFHETSLSDTEADSYDNNAEDQDVSFPSLHQRATSTDLSSHTFGDEAPSVIRDDTALGRSFTDYEWKWGDVPQATAKPRRQRILSSNDVENSSETNENGKLTYASQDPYKFILQLGDSEHLFDMSLCHYDVAYGKENSEEDEEKLFERFEDNKISYQRFLEDDQVVNDERLVIRYNQRYLTWENASTVLATLSLYRQTLGLTLEDSQDETTDSRNQRDQDGSSVWRRWWGRNRESVTDDATSLKLSSKNLSRAQTDSALDTKNVENAQIDVTEVKEDAKPKPTPKRYAKTLRLTSDQLKSLNLRKGANNITFSVTSSYSGVATCSARIFLWESTHQIVVSDIDGTITKSDALGHVFTMIGRDWTHSGVAKLYTDIARNGYRIMYLTSRAIGQADTTRDYLRSITQANYKLPDGPVIMSPDRLIASLHREVILRKPEVFKMACLRDIARLFGADPRKSQPLEGFSLPGAPQAAIEAANGPGAGSHQSPSGGAATNIIGTSQDGHDQTTPFYAGFGNRITDALSYRSVNIPSSRIFTIDSNGEVKMELLELAGYKSSYIHMTDLVDQMFPPITFKSSKGEAGKPEFNDFNYWRPDIGNFDLPSDDELVHTPLASSPTSPALSARSVKSMKSNASLRSNEDISSIPGGGEDASANTSRLSRFGLGKLGLSRRSSAQTIATPSSATDDKRFPSNLVKSSSEEQITKSATELPSYDRPPRSGSNFIGDGPIAEAARRISPPSSPSSYGSGATSWAASWRRRTASPTGQNTANVHATSPLVGPAISADPDEIDDDDDDSHGAQEDDDDISSFEEGVDGQGQSIEGSRQQRRHSDMGDDVLDDDDPLLATGEIQFEWRG